MLAKEIPLLEDMEVHEVRGVDVHVCHPRKHEDSGGVVVPVWFRHNQATYTFMEDVETTYDDIVRGEIIYRVSQILNISI